MLDAHSLHTRARHEQGGHCFAKMKWNALDDQKSNHVLDEGIELKIHFALSFRRNELDAHSLHTRVRHE